MFATSIPKSARQCVLTKEVMGKNLPTLYHTVIPDFKKQLPNVNNTKFNQTTASIKDKYFA